MRNYPEDSDPDWSAWTGPEGVDEGGFTVVVSSVIMLMVVTGRTCMVMGRAGNAKRLKHGRNRVERDLFPLKHLPNSDIIFHQQAIFLHRDGKMQVPDLPGNCRSLGSTGDGDGQEWLGCLADQINSRGRLKKNRFVLERTLEVEAEILSIRRPAAPAPLGQGLPIDA